MQQPRPPSLPKYDADKDGNPFAWIVERAPQAREDRLNYQDQYRRDNRRVNPLARTESK